MHAMSLIERGTGAAHASSAKESAISSVSRNLVRRLNSLAKITPPASAES